MSRGGASIEYLYGVHPVREALLARRRDIKEVWLQQGEPDRRRGRINDLACRQGIAVNSIGAAKLKSLLGPVSHQGVVAKVGRLPVTPLAQVLPRDSARKSIASDHGVWLLLDSIVDPHNLGAIIRTSLCAGVKAVITPKDRSAPFSPAVSKASAGALEHMPLVSVTNLADTIKTLKSHGMWVAGLDADADTLLYRQDLTGRLALVVGGEEKGIRPRVKQQCDFLLAIPQLGKISSLNASVAAAVVMFEALRQQRDASGIQ